MNGRRGQGVGETRQVGDGFSLIAIPGYEQPQPFRAQFKCLERQAAERQRAFQQGAFAVRTVGAAEQSPPRGAEPQGAQNGRGGNVSQARHLHAEHLGRIWQRLPSRFLEEPPALFTA